VGPLQFDEKFGFVCFAPLPDLLPRNRVGRLAFVLADNAGKGIAAALLTASLQANIRRQMVSAIGQPERFLASVNRLLFENAAITSYATLFFAAYDDATSRIHYANCGHLPGLILRVDGSLERLDSTTTGRIIRRMVLLDAGELPGPRRHARALQRRSNRVA